MKQHWKPAAAALLLALTLGCSGSRAFRDAKDEEALQHWDLAVLKYARALDLDPTNSRYKISLERAKLKASQFHFSKGNCSTKAAY